ncbi:hypothetical protein BDU57DRAFT_216757 [Ampelomyces quisqualis]|uniref:Oxidoreductase-like protein n=1 Tax=Ampelomyces quisqualis TaxID=50730 RepID=A0A6A5QMS4_AMPQU|nr:hypothetical protein BDU57DRAFT_216757 [Ampelomyces quisqualis]
MSTPAIEAKSLSSLTALAANPPAYPRNPTHVRNEPLVLYIARVPGSKDVFLSPMKPRQKVVTAEDITSSLYFLHVEQPEDANLVVPPHFQEPNYQEARAQATNAPPLPALVRKAVPGTTGHEARKPVSKILAPVENFGQRQNMSAGNHTQRSGLLALDMNSRRSYDSQSTGENCRPIYPPNRPPEGFQSSGKSLTLIRRDPASGAQWNVARIEDPSMVEVSSSTLGEPESSKRTGAPMYIDVINPGYSKFLQSDTESRSKLMSRKGDLFAQLSQPGSVSQSQSQANNTSNTFRRRLWMEGSQYTNRGFGHRKNSSYDFNSGRPDSRGSYDAQTNASPFDTKPSPSHSFLTRDDQTYSTIQISDRPTSFRGYVFTSPWNGRCEFMTGTGGGSLKCRHIVPGLQGALPAAMTVSELRFNLPSSSIPSTPQGEQSSKRSSFFHRERHSRNHSSLSVNRDETENNRSSLDRLDLSLGQEFAGGGFGGKQAKLGKIILEDEGLKMMDLLVAANLALWWRAYEKVISSRGGRGSI